jgi:trk system potassium uptake protein TrkA
MTRLIVVGGGETIETVYFLAKHFADQGYHITIVNPHPAEAQMLSRRLEATVILGDGSDPAVLEEAGARRAGVLLSLAPYDPDNLVACQIAQKLYGVPRTLALVNDPDNEEIFRRLGISQVFSATKVIGTLLRGQTVFEEITQLIPAAEGRVQVTEVVLNDGSPAAGQILGDLALPEDSLVAAIVRRGQVLVPGGESRLQVGDRLILITRPASHQQALHLLAGEDL